MSRYDGLIIPRSYNEYINKTDAATLQQALQLQLNFSSYLVNYKLTFIRGRIKQALFQRNQELAFSVT